MRIRVALLMLALPIAAAPFDAPEHRQFDFWLGKWDVNLRILQPDGSWKDSVKARAEIYSVLDGKAVLELWDSPTIKGFSLRHYDPARKQWVLYLNWPSNSRSSVGSLSGRFRDGRGEFESKWTQANGAIGINRFTFSDITRTSLRWSDAYSRDGGKTWRHQWIMEFSRSAKAAPLPQATLPTYTHGGRCIGPSFDSLTALAGHWSDGTTKLRVQRALDGCSVLAFLENGKRKAFALLTFNPQRNQVEQLWLDNATDTKALILRGSDLSKLSSGAVTQAWTRGQRALTITTTRDGKQETNWVLRRAPDAAGLALGDAVNKVCPRSNRPIAADSLTRYRGKVVGFCNPGCRDDFAANQTQRPKDRTFFDKLIDG